MERFRSSLAAAKVIGASEGFVRQNGRETRVRGKFKHPPEFHT